ncbi:MAG: Gfo/Idh/MocA family oxidoreductase [Candidatus Hydrogenedentes bacterium]|nr:Gfo/Idh/MocA family oxidoreductase [Candidatus Hydrogenedentota bacterium]
MKRQTDGMNRRDFLRRAGQGTALAGAGMMLVERAEAKTAPRRSDPHAPSTGKLLGLDQVIGLGIIGVGGMGSGHCEELLEREKNGDKIQLRAVSDVYGRRKRRAQKMAQDKVGRNIEAYTDYLELLARDDIDGVVIATPDHWHALCSIHAMEHGKDVYCQKPITLTVEESTGVRDKVYETGRVLQCGAQHCSDDFCWQARRFIKEGGIGEVLYAQADYSRNSAGGPNDRGGEWNYRIDPDASDDPAAGEAYIDWEQWLGPAPKRPFSKPRFFQFRKYWDYSGGIATDLLYHTLAPLTVALDAQAPEKAVAGGGIYVQHDDREVPDTFLVALDYPNDYSIVLTSSMANRQGNPTMIRGHRATIRPGKGVMTVTAEDEFKEWFKKRYGAEEIELKAQPREDHMTNWLNAMRTRGPVHCDAETAYRAMAGVKMACDSWRQDKAIFWDGIKERYVKRHPRPDRTSKWPAEKW